MLTGRWGAQGFPAVTQAAAEDTDHSLLPVTLAASCREGQVTCGQGRRPRQGTWDALRVWEVPCVSAFQL